MNKTAIRNFAVWARNKLIADVSYHAGLMGITKNGVAKALPQSTKDVEFYDIGTAEPYVIRGEEILQRKSLVDAIRTKEKDSNYETAYNSLMEEVAYTWFNRLIAVRFMEVNDYLPEHVRVLSSEIGKLEPDIVTTPFDAELFFAEGEQQKIIQMKNDNKLDEVFRILFIKQCRELSRILPRLFEGTNDYTELLLNLSFIDQEGVVYHLVHDIPEDDFNVENGGQVEIIGWLYQYYNAEPKEELINAHKKYYKDDIPFVTQLFTSDWIVKYMVENSLGRYLSERFPLGQIKQTWEYFLSGEETEHNEDAIPIEKVKIIDPCMGSGHILVYAFDIFMQVYESLGWSKRDAAKQILQNNIYGLDIDERAAQLAYFSVMMKARRYNRQILSGDTICNIFSIKESNDLDGECIKGLPVADQETANDIRKVFNDAKIYGSLLNCDIDSSAIEALTKSIFHELEKPNGSVLDIIAKQQLAKVMLPLARQGILLSQRYEVVITNPPYMGTALMPDKLKSFLSERFAAYKGDLFSAFAKRVIDMTCKNGHIGLLMPYVWMFISSYQEMREWIIKNTHITTLVQLEYNAFEAACVPVAAFTIEKNTSDGVGEYVRLSEFRGVENQGPKTVEAVKNKDCGYRYETEQKQFLQIPGYPIAYWISQGMRKAFIDGKRIGEIANPRQGLATADNNRFLRMWHEIDIKKASFNSENIDESKTSGCKWFPYNKGGDFRKWFGNNDYLVNWYNDGEEIRNFKDEKGKVKSRPQNTQYYFKECISWSLISSSSPAFRYKPNGFIFDVAGMSCFSDTDLKYLLALCNTKLVTQILRILAPTINYQVGDIANIPVIDDEEKREEIEAIANQCIDLSKKDWDSFETSWDFKKHPLI